MSTLFKKGFDWFPFDVNFFRNRKVRMVRGRYGSDGVDFLIYLYCIIHELGFYVVVNDDFYYIAADDTGFSYEKIGQMMNFFLERSLFEDTLFKTDKVLTSRRIQMQFQDLVKSRKQVVEVDANLWLLPDEKTKECIKVASKKGSSEKNGVNSWKNNQNSKKTDTEYSRADNITVNDSIAEDAAVAAFRKYEQLIGLITPSVQDGIDFFISQGVEVQLIIRLIEYACEQGKRTWAYIKASIKGNMDAGIKTLDAYNRAQAQRAETARRVKESEKKKGKGINNYNDTNFKAEEYTADKFIAEMLGEK